MKQDHTHITLVVDRSGSMTSTKTSAEKGIAEFISDQKKVAGTCTVSLIDFDDVIESKFGPDDIHNFGQYLIHPRNGTALYDAIAKGIHSTESYVTGLAPADQPEKVIIVIVTDGQESGASKEYKHHDVKSLVDRVEKGSGWQIVFIGADINAAMVTDTLGIRNVSNYAGGQAKSVGGVYSGLSAATATFRTTGVMDANFNVAADGTVVNTVASGVIVDDVINTRNATIDTEEEDVS